MGAHKDVFCDQCQCRFEVGASQENRSGAANVVVGGVCPNCRHLNSLDLAGNSDHKTFNGDRIVVNKYAYTLAAPERWDVIVFKFPGNPKQNYIKRLVGLPGETLTLDHGNVYRVTADQPDREILRKPAAKVTSMSHLVHDTGFPVAGVGRPPTTPAGGNPGDPEPIRRPATLGKLSEPPSLSHATLPASTAGDPLARPIPARLAAIFPPLAQRIGLGHSRRRWFAGQDRPLRGPGPSPISTRTTPPSTWDAVRCTNGRGRRHPVAESVNWWPRFAVCLPRCHSTRSMNPAVRLTNSTTPTSIRPTPQSTHGIRDGMHWVGELMLTANVSVDPAADSGAKPAADPAAELTLEIVKAGTQYQCVLNLGDGTARFRILREGAPVHWADAEPSAATSIRTGDTVELRFCNYDHQLRLWIDGDELQFDAPTTFDESDFRTRQDDRPHWSPATSAGRLHRLASQRRIAPRPSITSESIGTNTTSRPSWVTWTGTPSTTVRQFGVGPAAIFGTPSKTPWASRRLGTPTIFGPPGKRKPTHWRKDNTSRWATTAPDHSMPVRGRVPNPSSICPTTSSKMLGDGTTSTMSPMTCSLAKPFSSCGPILGPSPLPITPGFDQIEMIR